MVAKVTVSAHSKRHNADCSPMTPAELVAAGEAVFGRRWCAPLARAIGRNVRLIRFWRAGERRIPPAVAEQIRCLARIGPVGEIIRIAVRKVLPHVAGWAPHRIAQQALADLDRVGLLGNSAAEIPGRQRLSRRLQGRSGGENA